MHAVDTGIAIETIDSDGKVRGTETDAHRIAALIEGGMRPQEVVRDYPGLTVAQVTEAVAYAKAHPEQRRPYPSRTVKSALRQGKGGLAQAFAANDE